jgi:hypothetical protein
LSSSIRGSVDDDGLQDGDGHLDALWVHGLLRGLADSPEARAARLDRFLAQLRLEPHTWPRALRVPRTVIGAALAASLLLGGLILSFGFPSASASPATIVRRAQDAYRIPLDRRYHVRWKARPGLETLSSSKEAYLWTRGDRFWLELQGRVLGCGRDEHCRVWVARTRQIGIRFDAAESLPRELAVTCSICTMQLGTLLSEVLRDFDLRHESTGAGADGPSDSIHAVLKPERQPGSVKEAWLEIDRRTHLVRRLVLHRHDAVVTSTLIETGSLGDEQYTLKGHLDADARIYTRSRHPEMRRQELLESAGGSEQPL